MEKGDFEIVENGLVDVWYCVFSCGCCFVIIGSTYKELVSSKPVQLFCDML